MKQFLPTCLLLLIGASGPGQPELTAADASPPAVADLVGSWRVSSPVGTCEIEFRTDGVFRGHLHDDAGFVWTFRGQWELIGHQLHYTYTASSWAQVPEGSEDMDTLVRVTPDFFEIRNQAGHIERYRRIEKLTAPPTSLRP